MDANAEKTIDRFLLTVDNPTRQEYEEKNQTGT
jgi:hypothetical protein